jgi:sensor histidine kinase regulating citrate/malate metabolism
MDKDIFKAVINSIYNGIVIIDHLGKIIVFNDAAERNRLITFVEDGERFIKEILACRIT